VVVVVTMRRARWISRLAGRFAIRLAGLVVLTFTGLTWWISPFEGASETCTAPPPSIAPPAAAAASFANAIRTDMIVASVLVLGGRGYQKRVNALLTLPYRSKNADGALGGNAVNRVVIGESARKRDRSG
jgi:hypothetical protein